MGKRGKRPEEGQYVPLPYAILKSNAWRSLSGAAVKLFLELHTRYNGSNNGNIRLSMNEAVRALGLGKATVQRAFIELETKGFIQLTKRGNWYGRQASEWRLTTKPMQTTRGNDSATTDWRFWSPAKTKHGSDTEPSKLRMVPRQNSTSQTGSETEPARPISQSRLGSGMEH